jgi:hypothetical protein
MMEMMIVSIVLIVGGDEYSSSDKVNILKIVVR